MPGKRPRLHQTNASFDAQEGSARASPPPATALSRRTPHSPRISPQGLHNRAQNQQAAEVMGSWGGGSRGAPRHRQSPLRDRRAARGRESGGSLGGAQTSAAQPTAPRAGEGGVSRLLFPGTFTLTGRIGGCERTPTMSWLGEGERWLRVSDPSHLSQLNTKGRRRNV